MESDKLTIAVAFNVPADKSDNDLDYHSEAAVKGEAEAVFNALYSMGHYPVYLPVNDIENDLMQIRKLNPQIIFNLCEGYRGSAHQEKNIAGLWELINIPYTGNPAFTLGLAQNKVLTKKLFESRKIPTPMYQVYTTIPTSTYLPFPVIAKPAAEDASLGISLHSVVNNFDQLKSVVSELINKYKQPVLAEKFIAGREFNVSVFGNHPPRILPISEINFDQLGDAMPHITSYEAKWLTDHPAYLKTPAICPANIVPELSARITDTALQVFRLLGGRDYGRIDMRVDTSGKIYVLEYNPNPDISPDAGFARALAAAKIQYETFVGNMIHEALNRN